MYWNSIKILTNIGLTLSVKHAHSEEAEGCRSGCWSVIKDSSAGLVGKKHVSWTTYVHYLHVHTHLCCCEYLIIPLEHIRHPTLALLTRPAAFPIIIHVKSTSQGLQSLKKNAKVSSRRLYLINRCSQCKVCGRPRGSRAAGREQAPRLAGEALGKAVDSHQPH